MLLLQGLLLAAALHASESDTALCSHPRLSEAQMAGPGGMDSGQQIHPLHAVPYTSIHFIA